MKKFTSAFLTLAVIWNSICVLSIAATESKSEKPAITNIFMQLGSDITQRNLTWFSLSRDLGVVTYAKASEMIEGAFPENATKVGAYRANSLRSFKSGYYYNKATMTDLLPGESYCY